MQMQYSQLLKVFKESGVQYAELQLSKWNKDQLKLQAETVPRRSVLHYACHNGWTALSIRLIEDYEFDPNTGDDRGHTSLHMACMSGNSVLVKNLIVDHRCDPLRVNGLGNNALDTAIIAKNSNVVRYLIKECGCDDLCKTMGMRIMKYLFQYWDERVAMCLICDGGCQLTMENGTTLLHEFARQVILFFSSFETTRCCLSRKVLFLLTRCNCDPNMQDEYGNTIFHQVSKQILTMETNNTLQHDLHNILKQLLIECKCDPCIMNNQGETALHIICYSLLQQGYNDNLCCALYYILYIHKASPRMLLDKSDKTLMYIVSKTVLLGNHNSSILHYLIKEYNLYCEIDKDIVLTTLLQAAIIWRDAVRTLCYLLKELKIDPHITHDNNELVCLMCYPITVKHLIASKQVENCYVCYSDHDYNKQASNLSVHDTFITFICKEISNLHMNESCILILKFLCYCIAFIECNCNFYMTVATYETLIDNICLFCLSNMNDPVCTITIRRLIALDCHMYLSDTFISKLLNFNHCDILEDLQNHLIEKQPYRLAKCICMKGDYHKVESLFYFIIDKYNLVQTTDEQSGNTILHEACQYFHGDTALIEYILSTGKADPLHCNNDGRTPIMLLSERDHVGSKKSVQQLISRFGKVKVSHPIESYVNLVVLGNPGVGKSSLVKVINDRSSVRYAIGRRYITGIKLDTAGIIPHIVNDNDLGRIILHDLAGQAEYYSSHTAVIEKLLQGSPAIFILVISLADESLRESLQFWLTAIENVSHNSLQQCHLQVVASHADEVIDSSAELDTLRAILTNRFPSSSTVHNDIVQLDCRKLAGSQLDLLISSLANACKTINTDSMKEMSLYCHMLYDYFQRDKKIAYKVESLLETINKERDLFLPAKIDSLLDIICDLSSTGLIMYLESKESLANSWIVTDKSILLSDLDGILFAPKAFKQHVNIASNTGVIKLSHLSALFENFNSDPNYDSELLVHFLQYMELCEVISEEFANLNAVTSRDRHHVEDNVRYIFVPALIKETNKPIIEETFYFGWYLRCSNQHHFFLSRFLHLVLLHLAYKYSISSSGANKFEQLCKVWTTGIYWKDIKGVEILVELVDNNQSLVLLASCKEGAGNEMMKLVKEVIVEILTCKQQVLPKVDTWEFVIDASHLKYPLKSWEELTLYNITLLAKCCIDNDRFIADKAGIKITLISDILPEVTTEPFYESVFAGRDIKVYTLAAMFL